MLLLLFGLFCFLFFPLMETRKTRQTIFMNACALRLAVFFSHEYVCMCVFIRMCVFICTCVCALVCVLVRVFRRGAEEDIISEKENERLCASYARYFTREAIGGRKVKMKNGFPIILFLYFGRRVLDL